MPLRALVIVVMAPLLALFVAVNWTAFMTADDRTGRSAEIARLGDEVRLAIDQAANGHAAQLGELQDRLARNGPG